MPILNANGYGNLGAYGGTGPINALLDKQEVDPIYPYTEPVTLQQVKDYMKVDYNDDDELISDLLVTAREEIEEYCGLSLVPKRWIVQLRNDCGGIEIPYGPTPGDIDETLVIDYQGNAVDPSWISIKGNTFKSIYTPTTWLQLTYNAGYGLEGATTLPRGIATGIKAVVMFLYKNRGEWKANSGHESEMAAGFITAAGNQLVGKYRRNFDVMGF